MVQQQKQSTSESALINSQKNTALNAKDTTPNTEWTEKQQEILRDCLEEQVANEAYYSSLDEPHGASCNCVECN